MEIDYKLFRVIIEGIKVQYDNDKAVSRRLSEIYGSDINPPNNSRLYNSLFAVLHLHFPPVDGFCRIQTFCWDLDFGRGLDSSDPIAALWDELIVKG